MVSRDVKGELLFLRASTLRPADENKLQIYVTKSSEILLKQNNN